MGPKMKIKDMDRFHLPSGLLRSDFVLLCEFTVGHFQRRESSNTGWSASRLASSVGRCLALFSLLFICVLGSVKAFQTAVGFVSLTEGRVHNYSIVQFHLGPMAPSVTAALSFNRNVSALRREGPQRELQTFDHGLRFITTKRASFLFILLKL